MDVSLLINAIIAGLLLGAFYAAVTAGISISFGMLDIVNIAHPAFIIVGSYIAYILNTTYGFDPILVSIVVLPAFYLLGAAIYQVYHVAFEIRGQESLRGLAFFFGLLFVIEIPLRLLVPCITAIVMFAVLEIFLGRSFIGRAVMAVSQDPLALKLMAVDPTRIKRIAFGISIATASMAGAFLIIIQPVIPSVGRDYIGRIFAICVLGGLGSLPGTMIAALLLGVVESLTSTFYGPSWAPAVSFGILLLTLAVRPSGLLGR